MISTALLAAALSTLSATAADPTPPPGMVYLKGRRVKVGLDPDVAKDKIIELEGQRTTLWGETPMHDVRVDDFFMMITEVTNEQFAEFVLATGSKPPELWGKDEIDTAQSTFLEVEGKARAEAIQNGERPPERKRFVRGDWWDQNWEGKKWKIPEGSEALPVTHVNFASAEAYARWAGLRLPTEFEFQRAARGDTKNLFPWGNDWDDAKAVTIEMHTEVAPVGSRLGGVTEDGIFDLAGNVWEWTSSPYVPYPKYETDTIKVKEAGNTRYIDLLVDWDPNNRVTVGGSYMNPSLAARVTTRRPTERVQTTTALGFRCTATPRVGLDMATLIEEKDLARGIRADNKFDMSLTVAMDRWKSKPGSAARRYENEEENPLASYAVITDYDYVLFTPVLEVDGSNVKQLAKETIDGEPIVLGFFATTAAIDEPKLDPGTYVLAWRGAGESRRKPKKEEAVAEGEAGNPRMREDDEEEEDEYVNFYEGLEFDPKKENFIVLDANGDPLLAIETPGLGYERMRDGELEARSIPADAENAIQAYDLLTIHGAVAAGRKAFTFDLSFQVRAGFTEGDWRR